MNVIRRDAVFSDDLRHRFELSRIWDESKGLVLFVGLNPSKAGRDFDDMTVRKGIGFAQLWGLGGTLHGNTFSRISTDPAYIEQSVDAVRQPDNVRALLAMAQRAAVIVYAWGAFPQFSKAFAQVADLLAHRAPVCLGLTRDGFPRHISRLPYLAPRTSFAAAIDALRIS